MTTSRIIVVGGGFGGVKCASTLRKNLPKAEYDIVLFAEENHMVFHPLLAEVAAAAVSPKDMAAPLRELLPGVRTRTETVEKIDLAKSEIAFEDDEGNMKTMSYDHIVIACGNTSNLAFIPGMADHAFPLKVIGDALALQAHVIDQLERAEICDDPERRDWYLSFVIVGGGFSGVELAGELNDLVRGAARYYSNFKASDVSVTLVHSGDEILPEVSSSLRQFAQKEMEKHKVKFLLKSRAVVCTSDGVKLKDGRFLSAGTVACTIGARALPMIERLDVPKDKGRILVAPDMSVPGYDNAWAIGDCAAIKNEYDDLIAPTTGQFAEREGAQVAKNIVARLRGQRTKPFSHKSLGTLCSIGGRKAVAETFGFKVSGFLAWFIWRGVYLMKLPSLSQKVRVAIDWTFDLFFPPALTSVKTNSSQRIGNAHFGAGDIIYNRGDLATDFYVVEQGEVELFVPFDNSEEVVAVLGVGDFFGEIALTQENGLRENSCRARTETEVLIMGKNVFNHMSQVLTPFRDAIAGAMKRRTSIWTVYPDLHRIVSGIKLKDLMEPIFVEPLRLDNGLYDCIEKINKNKLDFVYVVDESEKLSGVVTRSDLLRAIEVAAANPGLNQGSITVKDIMVTTSVVVTIEDDLVLAISTMREHGFKRIPVVQSRDNRTLLGNIRIENVMERLLRELQVDGKAMAGAATSSATSDQARPN
jgi:NADH dehydrogenase